MASTRTNKRGNEYTVVTIWVDPADLSALVQEAGRISSAEGRIVSRTEVIRAALKRAADEARSRGGRPVDPATQP